MFENPNRKFIICRHLPNGFRSHDFLEEFDSYGSLRFTDDWNHACCFSGPVLSAAMMWIQAQSPMDFYFAMLLD